MIIIMGWIEIISLILNLVLGGGLFVTLATLRSVKSEAASNAKKAAATAQASEIENVEAVITLWRKLAESMAEKQEDLTTQVEELHTEVRRLKNATNRVARLLDRITPENMSEMVDAIKKEIDDEQSDIVIPAVADNRMQSSTAGSAGSRSNR